MSEEVPAGVDGGAVAGGGAEPAGIELRGVELLRLEVSARCGCGEPLERGEHAGFDPVGRELLCLWCLADLRAGRRRPRRRASRPDVPQQAPWPVARQAPDPAAAARWGAGAGHAAYPTTVPLTTRRRRRNGPNPVVTGALTVLVVCVALLGLPYLLSARSDGSAAGSSTGQRLVDLALGQPIQPSSHRGVASSWPPPPGDAQRSPLGHPPQARSSSTAYAFMTTTPSGRPVAFDPCRPIHLVVNDSHAPAGADQLLREAADAVAAATGLVLVVEGRTDEVPASKRPPMDQARYGNRWSPVLVAWTDEDTVPELAGRVAGIGGPVMAPYSREGEMHFVSGLVYLDSWSFAQLMLYPDGHDEARAIVMHELAHLVGLAHVHDSSELMNADNTGQTAFGPGDLEGLRRLGAGPCFSG